MSGAPSGRTSLGKGGALSDKRMVVSHVQRPKGDKRLILPLYFRGVSVSVSGSRGRLSVTHLGKPSGWGVTPMNGFSEAERREVLWYKVQNPILLSKYLLDMGRTL